MPSDDIPVTDPEPPPPSSSPTSTLEADSESQAPPSGQLILGTDKRNPVFAIYEIDSGERLAVYYGFEIIETVNNDCEDPGFKMLLGRLYNAGLKLSALCQSFETDAKTIRRWGKAVRQGDPVELLRVLEGRAARRKRTVVIEKFARLRWPDLVAERSYGAVGRLQREIQSVFRVGISRSGLKDLIRELKADGPPRESSPTPEPPSSTPPNPESPLGPIAPTDWPTHPRKGR